MNAAASFRDRDTDRKSENTGRAVQRFTRMAGLLLFLTLQFWKADGVTGLN